MQSNVFKTRYLLFFIFFSLIIFFLFFPITFTLEKKGQIIIFSSGYTNILLFDELSFDFNNNKFFFYYKLPYHDIQILNIINSPLRMQKGENLIQKQNRKSSAMVFYKDSHNLFKFDNYYYNRKWLEAKVKDVSSFLHNIGPIEEKVYILHLEMYRSFQILPNVYIISSFKDLAHELSHYFFGYQVKADANSTWHELLCEVNSVLFLRSFSRYRYLKELELKTVGFYYEPYGKSVINFLEYFNYDQERIFELERFILKNYKSLDDKEFENIIKKF
ncbi:MAG TPA: hypothetical protein PLO45_03220 [Defluviitoga sp.]|nr:hypothetical protein [Defluviitoga sp.]HOP24309.1 hypothetical protein [Defluviitoga sp.]HPZ28099.1 hypothetical protein [Defluviitoga sp.]